MNIKKPFLFLSLLLTFIAFAYASQYTTTSQSDFNNGTYYQTFYNTSGFVQLNATYTTGNYTSEIFGNATIKQWNNISWYSHSDLSDMTDIVGLWHLDETSGTVAVDSSGQGNNGTLMNMEDGDWISGKLNNALQFDGIDEYVNFYDIANFDINDAFSLELWFKTTTSTTDVLLDRYGNSRGWTIYLENGKLVFAFASTSGNFIKKTTVNTYTDNVWYYVTLTYSGSGLASGVVLYINGEITSMVTNSDSLTATTLSNLNCSLASRGTILNFEGELDEVAIWNKTLSLEEVLDSYNKGISRLNLTVRSCNDSLCLGEYWVDINNISPQTLTIANNSYFQYNFEFETDNATYTPKLYNVTIDYTSDIAPPLCTLISQTPSDLEQNSTGVFTVIINCTDETAINNTRFFITRTMEGFTNPGIPNYWSIRPPANNKTENNVYGYSIFLADGRQDGKWYEDIGVFNDNFTYAVTDNSSIRISTIEGSNFITINYTWIVEPAVFRSMVYLTRGTMEKEDKTNQVYNIYNDNGLLIKIWDLETIRLTTNYTLVLFENLNYLNIPNKDLLAYYCNSSYNPTSIIKPEGSPNCAYLNALNGLDIDIKAYTSRNSSYVKTGVFAVTNGMIAGVTVTKEGYIYYKSESIYVAGYYQYKYANGTSGTNISFAESNVAWTTTNGGVTWIQANFTPDFWLATIKDQDEFNLGIYIEDTLGNVYQNFTFLHNDIGDVNHPISSPSITYYCQGSGETCLNGEDYDLNKTYYDTMAIYIGISLDADGIGTVNHSLYLINIDGTYNFTINNSFYSLDDSDIYVDFNTSFVPDGIYKLNISAVADDDSTDFQSHLTFENFTIDNTYPSLTVFSPTNDTKYTSSSISLSYYVEDNNLDMCQYSLNNNPNQTLTENITLTLSTGIYNLTVSCLDIVEHWNTTQYIYFGIVLPGGGSGGIFAKIWNITDIKNQIKFLPFEEYKAENYTFFIPLEINFTEITSLICTAHTSKEQILLPPTSTSYSSIGKGLHTLNFPITLSTSNIPQTFRINIECTDGIKTQETDAGFKTIHTSYSIPFPTLETSGIKQNAITGFIFAYEDEIPTGIRLIAISVILSIIFLFIIYYNKYENINPLYWLIILAPIIIYLLIVLSPLIQANKNIILQELIK